MWILGGPRKNWVAMLLCELPAHTFKNLKWIDILLVKLTFLAKPHYPFFGDTFNRTCSPTWYDPQPCDKYTHFVYSELPISWFVNLSPFLSFPQYLLFWTTLWATSHKVHWMVSCEYWWGNFWYRRIHPIIRTYLNGPQSHSIGYVLQHLNRPLWLTIGLRMKSYAKYELVSQNSVQFASQLKSKLWTSAKKDRKGKPM